MHKGGGVVWGGVSTPHKPAKNVSGGWRKERKRKEKGKIRQKIGKIRLKIEKRGRNRRKSSNLAKNRYKWLKIVSSYAKNRNHRDLT